jgi:glutamine synthetase
MTQGLFSAWTEAQHAAAETVERQIAEDGIELVRFAFVDQHGVIRGKTLVAEEAPAAMRKGVAATSTLLLKDSSHRTVFPVWTPGSGFGVKALEGAADFLLMADPTTFRLLPWAGRTGWVLCDGRYADGQPLPFCTRSIMKAALGALAGEGYEYLAGLEVEFHLFRRTDPRLAPGDAGQPGTPPDVALLTQGYNYLTELKYDQLDPILELLRRDLQALGLPLRSMEVEFGPSQVEFTFQPALGLAAADNMILFRNAVKQIADRHGYHATFMCRPKIPHVMSSGWHLHQSLRGADGRNAFMGEGELLSPVARHFMAGLLAHARAAAAFSTPTLNGYRRYRPNSLAPDRAVWGRDNRGVMVRVLGAPGEAATRLENRVGEPAANPYLYMASQIIAGLDGMARRADPGPSADAPYDTAAPMLPRSLAESLAALEESALFRAALPEGFVDYFLRLKRAEIARFEAEVTEWEQREYFSLF